MSRSRAQRRAASLATKASVESADIASKAYGVNIASTGILDYISGSAQAIDKILNAAEVYWKFANSHPWVGSAVRIISDAIGSEGYEVVDPSNDRDQDSIDCDQRIAAIKNILDHPNNDQRLADLIAEIAMDLDVVGKAYAHILRFGSQMTGLERIDARTMAPALSNDGRKIEAFKQRIRINGLMTYTDYDPDDVVFFKLPGGPDITGGESLLEMLDLTLAVDYSARKHNAAYFRNGAKAGTVFVNKKMDQRQSELSMRTLEATRVGPDNAYRPTILAGEWDIHLPDTGGDEEYTKGQDRALQDVCAVFRTPESMLKTAEGALGQAGKEADLEMFHEQCVTPRARRIYRTISRRVLEDEFGYDPLELEIRPKSRYSVRVSQIPNALAALSAGASINEARALVGWPKSAFGEAGELDRPYIATTLVALQTDAEKQQALQAQQKVATQQQQAQQDHAKSLQAAHHEHQLALGEGKPETAVALAPSATKAYDEEPDHPKDEARRSGRFRTSRPSTLNSKT